MNTLGTLRLLFAAFHGWTLAVHDRDVFIAAGDMGGFYEQITFEFKA